MKDIFIRTVSGVGFVAVVLASLLFNKFLYAAFFAAILVGMMAEFYRMTLHKSFRYSRILATAGAVILFLLTFIAAAYPGISYRIVGWAILPLLIVMINSLYAKAEDFSKFSHIYTGLVYIGIPLALSNLIVFNGTSDFDGSLMLGFFIIIWCSDVGAYMFGCSLGQKLNSKKLFPSISPKKSWIGFWGGFLGAMLSAVVMKFAGLLDFPLIHCLVLSAIMHVAGVYGDLFESKWKRTCGVKDSGTIIPGHGGLLDRFDSAIMAIPAGALYLLIINML